jgi:hypothetical protein
MKRLRNLALGAALLPASASFAQSPQQPIDEEWPPMEQEAPPFEQEPRPIEQPPRPTQMTEDRRLEAEVKAHVLPVVAGIESAELAIGALHELATAERFQRRDARKTAELAEHGVRIAHERAQELQRLRGLSDEERRAAQDAARQLQEARSTLRRVNRQVGTIEGMLRRQEAENVRSEAQRLQSELRAARTSIEKVASAYDVPMHLEIRQQMR